MPYRKVCRNCHTEYVDDDRAALAAREFCSACFDKLPDAIEFFGDEPAAPDAGFAQPQAQAQQPQQAHPQMPAQQQPQADAGFGPWGFGAGSQVQQPQQAQPQQQAPTAPSGWPAWGGAPAGPQLKAYELHWVGTNRASSLPVILPDADSGGYVGRDPQLCDVAIDRPTISRLQLGYRNAEGGGIEITNFSQYGTWVNGRLLQRNESAVAQAGSAIEMGGFPFELRERSN